MPYNPESGGGDMPNNPVKLYLSDELLEALQEASAMTGDELSPNGVAVDVIQRCLPIWIAARQAFDGVIDDALRETLEAARERRARQKKQ